MRLNATRLTGFLLVSVLFSLTLLPAPALAWFGGKTVRLGGPPQVSLSPTLSRIVLPLARDGGCERMDLVAKPAENRSTIQLDADAPAEGEGPVTFEERFDNRNLRRFYVELTPEGRFQVFIDHATPYTVESTCGNNALTVEVKERYQQVEYRRNLARGLDYVQHKSALSAGREFRTHTLYWNPTDSEASLKALTPSPYSLRGLKPVKHTLEQYGAVAGVNASFFNSKLKIPLGIVVRDGELLNGTLYNRVALGLDARNQPGFERLELQGRLSMGLWRSPINVVNMPRTDAAQVALYTQLYGEESPPAGGGNVAIRVRNGFVEAVSESGPLPFEQAGDWVFYGRAVDLAPLLNTPLGAQVDAILSTNPDWSDRHLIVAGGPYLLRNGQPYIDLKEEHFYALPPNNRRGRTAIGITPENRLLLMVVDHRLNGATLGDTADLLALFGAREGINLDGGSSSQIVVNNEVRYASTGGHGAAVSTALGFIRKTP